MSVYITSYKSISRLDSFESGILKNKDDVKADTVHPNYKDFIPPALVRRMSNAIKMGVGAALAAKGDEDIEGIIVGTGLGCLDNTEKFINQFIEREEGVLSPTAFIQSTHNTVAGQIGLILKDNCYNSTHTQRGASFETALIDAFLLCEETKGNVLVGAVDEQAEVAETFASKAEVNIQNFAEGASFFRLSQTTSESKVEIAAVKTYRIHDKGTNKAIESFLNTTSLNSPDLILYGKSFPAHGQGLEQYQDVKIKSYSDICGEYPSNSGFGMQMGAELLETDDKINRILVVNNFADQRLGLIYLQKP